MKSIKKQPIWIIILPILTVLLTVSSSIYFQSNILDCNLFVKYIIWAISVIFIFFVSFLLSQKFDIKKEKQRIAENLKEINADGERSIVKNYGTTEYPIYFSIFYSAKHNDRKNKFELKTFKIKCDTGNQFYETTRDIAKCSILSCPNSDGLNGQCRMYNRAVDDLKNYFEDKYN